jgi:hypothetical protein
MKLVAKHRHGLPYMQGDRKPDEANISLIIKVVSTQHL